MRKHNNHRKEQLLKRDCREFNTDHDQLVKDFEGVEFKSAMLPIPFFLRPDPAVWEPTYYPPRSIIPRLALVFIVTVVLVYSALSVLS